MEKTLNRLEQLTADVKAIYEAHKSEIGQLDRRGPNGGSNARFIKGWAISPHQTITRAANLAGKVTLNWWHGSAPTPGTAIPACIANDCLAAYNKIYNIEKGIAMTYIVETVKYKGDEITDSWNQLETQDLEAAKLMFESLKDRRADGYGVLLSAVEYPNSFYSLGELLEEYRNGQ